MGAAAAIRAEAPAVLPCVALTPPAPWKGQERVLVFMTVVLTWASGRVWGPPGSTGRLWELQVYKRAWAPAGLPRVRSAPSPSARGGTCSSALALSMPQVPRL